MFGNQFNSLKLLSDCPVCHKKQFPADIKVIAEQEEMHLLHITCKNCLSSLLVLVSLMDQGLNLVGVLTDLNSDEVKKFLDKEPVSADDCLEIHESIRSGAFVKEMLLK